MTCSGYLLFPQNKLSFLEQLSFWLPVSREMKESAVDQLLLSVDPFPCRHNLESILSYQENLQAGLYFPDREQILSGYGPGRQCAFEECGTLLRESNPGPFCSACLESLAAAREEKFVPHRVIKLVRFVRDHYADLYEIVMGR